MGSVDSLRSGLRPDRHCVQIAHLRSRTRSVELPTFPRRLSRSGRAGALILGIGQVYLVGPGRFELPTSCTPCKRATRLRYGPNKVDQRRQCYGRWQATSVFLRPLVPGGGVEPPHPLGYKILSLARLPIPPSGRFQRVAMRPKTWKNGKENVAGYRKSSTLDLLNRLSEQFYMSVRF